ncbi:MAG: flagellin [Deltaproteobacteria bacterium]|jgi:flagellin|nr:flagellin [Deltaproteobacteria bacterium]MBT4524980.1 flagellin [Deltaproteobacteria bacterium]
MTYRINHNVAALNSHRNVIANNNAMNKTLEKLSSGMKINRAADSPASLVISEQMRAQIAGLNQAIDNSETAVSLIQTTEANMAEINNLLVSIRQLAIHASNEGVNDEVMLAADQNEISNALETINRIANQAQFGTKRLLDGSRGASGSTTGENLEFVNASLASGDSREQGFDVKITQASTRAIVTGQVAITDELVKSGEKLTIIEDGKMATYVSNSDDTQATMIQNLQNEVNRNNLDITVSLDETGKIQANHNKFGSDFKFQVLSSTDGVMGDIGGEIKAVEAGLDIKGTINGESAIGKGQVLTGIKGAKCVDGLSIRYYGEGKEDLTQECTVADRFIEEGIDGQPPAEMEMPPDGISVGRVFVAQNSMRFHVGANQNQTVGISVMSAHPESLGRGIANASGYESLNDVDVTSFQGAQDTLALVDSAIDSITNARGDMGAFQKNTLESNLSNLRIQNENMVSSESVIRDVDMAKEMATFTRNQIMSQAATAMLAQANQLPQNVLSLLS